MIVLLSTALAGGYFYSDSGIVATGRGGAFVAGADTQFAQYYNPAGLIRIENPTLNVGLGLVQQNTSFERVRDDGSTLPEVENQASPFLVPQLGFAGPIIRDKLHFAFGMVSPYAPSADYDPAGAQRYSVIDTEIYQFSWGPSFAYRPHPVVTFGVGLQAKALVLEQSLNITAAGNDEITGDINVRARAVDSFAPNVNLGMLIEPHKAVSIGLAAQPPTNFQARGDATLDLTVGNLGNALQGDVDRFQDGNCTPDQVDPVCANEDGIDLSIRLPWVLRGGVAVRPVPELEVELAVVWQNWATLDAIRLTDVDPALPDTFVGPTEIDSEFELPAGLRNTTSIRLGAEWRANQLLELRMGGFYENGALSDERLTVALMDPWKVQVGGGASIHPANGRLRFDASVATLFFPAKEIRTSEIQQVFVPVLPGVGAAQTIGNGNYRSSGWIAAFQASVLFGKLPAYPPTTPEGDEP